MSSPFLELIDRLLYEEEGVALDFKRDQYPFVGASDELKAELLKDILAFANSWRRTDAYIVIGVEEVKGGRGNIVGITSQLDDAQLQQFVNAKVQRPVQFSYGSLKIEGKDIGVIHIPLQERPLYLQRDFGRLTGNTVYIRRGSSTDSARPDEVARMGRGLESESDVVLDVYFADPESRTEVHPEISSVVLVPPARNAIPDYEVARGPYDLGITHTNRDYLRELVRFTCHYHLLSPVYLAVRNSGRATAQDVRVEAHIAAADAGVVIVGADDFPGVPKREHQLTPVRFQTRGAPADVDAQRVQNTWLIQARVGKVQPAATAWLRDPFYLGARADVEVKLDIVVYADNLREPHRQALNIPVRSSTQPSALEDILELEKKRFASSSSHRAFLLRHGLVEAPDPIDPL